jgi:hypothetical protein
MEIKGGEKRRGGKDKNSKKQPKRKKEAFKYRNGKMRSV